MNVHSSGGYFMWPPSAYKQADRESLPYPPYGTLNYFDQTADAVLNRIYSYRGTAILPSRTGPVNDVLYSAAGNQADEAYYKNGIIAYAFETGADKRLADGTSIPVGFQPPFGAVPIGGNPNLANEGHDEAMEFAHGNYALLKSALDYANDTTPPTSEATGATLSKAPVGVRFTSNEASTIRYTTDGSTPTDASPEWKPNRPRELPDPVELGSQHDGQVVRDRLQGQPLRGPVEGLRRRHGRPDGHVHEPGRRRRGVHAEPPGAADVHLRRRELGRRELRRRPRAWTRARPARSRYSVTARDQAGNETVATRSYTVIPATNVDTPIVGSVPATLSLTLGTAGLVRELHPGRRAQLRLVDRRDGDVLGRRRAAERVRPEHEQRRAPDQRRLRAAAGAADARTQRDGHEPGVRQRLVAAGPAGLQRPGHAAIR